MKGLTAEQEKKRAEEIKKFGRQYPFYTMEDLLWDEQTKGEKLTAEEIREGVQRKEDYHRKVAEYERGLRAPNREAIRGLEKNQTIENPETWGVLDAVFECLNGEKWANSGEGLKLAGQQVDIYPIADGFVDLKDNVYGQKINARGQWARNLHRKLTHLFFINFNEYPDSVHEKVHNDKFRAMAIGVELMRFVTDNPHSELAKILNELPRRMAQEVKKNAATRPTAGKPPRYTEKKMGQAFERMHKLINNSGKTQLEAAAETIKRMKLDIGARYLTEAYRAWLPTRPQGKKT